MGRGKVKAGRILLCFMIVRRVFVCMCVRACLEQFLLQLRDLLLFRHWVV